MGYSKIVKWLEAVKTNWLSVPSGSDFAIVESKPINGIRWYRIFGKNG